jgi:exodeoxyribonuclease-5
MNTSATTKIKVKKSITDFIQFNEPTSEQINVLNAIQDFIREENSDDFMIVCGSAGTGKSSIMNAVVKYCHQENTRIQIAAPTAKAARIISAKTNDMATTLHSLLFAVSSKPEEAAIHFNLKSDDDDAFTIFIIDEASMVNSKVVRNSEDELFNCTIPVLHAIKLFVKSGNKKNKVIFVGDRYQLSPVGETDSNALYKTYLQNMFKWQGTQHELTEPNRFGKESYIYENATNYRESMINNTPAPSLDVPSLGNVFKAVPVYLNELREHGPNKVVAIAATHKQNRVFNHTLRELRYGKHAPKIAKGDVLNVKRNWKRNGLSLFNGDMVIVMDVDYDRKEFVAGLTFVPVQLKAKDANNEDIMISDYLLLETIDLGLGSMGTGKENPLYAERHKKNKTYRETGNVEDDRYLGAIRATYGYCITCNAAQGGEWDKVFLNTYFISNTRWAYTAVTRAKHELIKY